MLSLAMASVGLTALSATAEQAERPEYLDMTQQQRTEYVTEIQSFDYGILIESDSADYSQYYSGGAYAATTVMGWAGMSTAGTYGAYYALEWVGYIISESLERAGHDKEAAYFPHSDQFDIDLDYSNADPNGDFGNNLLFAVDYATGGDSTVVMEVVADATASMGYGMYKGFESNVHLMYYVYDDLKEDTVEETATNIVCKIPSVPCDSSDNRVSPYTSVNRATHGYDEFQTMYVANRSSRYYRSYLFDMMNKQGGFSNFEQVATGNGNDYIFGSNVAYGGGGNDTFVDVINAYGDSTLYGRSNGNGAKKDVIVRATNAYGGEGDDTIIDSRTAKGQSGDDLIINAVNGYGGDGDDTIQDSNTAYGGNGNDNLWGNARNFGNDGDDRLIGSDALSQWHWGGDGNDIIQGNGGNDQIFGENGYDILSEVVEENTYNLIDGGADEDSLRLVLKNSSDLYIDFSNSSTITNDIPSFDFAIVGDDTMLPLVTVKNVETLLFDDQSSSTFVADFTGLPQAITYEGNALANTVHGGENHDLIRGEKGRDTLYGGNGNDTLDGGSWPDRLYGEAGHDSLFPGLGNDYVDGGEGIDTVSYANLPDSIDADLSSGIVAQVSNNRTDTLINIENLIATDFNDTITGDSQDNLLVGGLGDDIIDGGDGDDTLVAVEGDDTLTGGHGSDTFELAHFRSNVQITDYNHSEGDVIQLDVYALGIPLDENGEAIISSYGGTQGGRYHAIYHNYHAKTVQLVIPSGEVRNIATLQAGHDFSTNQIQFINRDPALLYKTEANTTVNVAAPKYKLLANNNVGNLNQNWQTRNISSKAFADPMVFTSAPTFNGDDGGVIRLSNIDSDGFSVAFNEWDHLDNQHVSERFDYLVLDKGPITMADGTLIEVGEFSHDGTGEWRDVGFTDNFSQAPYVFLSIQTFYGTQPVVAVVKGITKDGFKAVLMEEEALMDGHAIESISYIAIQPASGTQGIFDSEQGAKSYKLFSDSLDHNRKRIGQKTYWLDEDISVDNEKEHALETVHVLEIGGISLIQQVSLNGGDTVSIRKQ